MFLKNLRQFLQVIVGSVLVVAAPFMWSGADFLREMLSLGPTQPDNQAAICFFLLGGSLLWQVAAEYSTKPNP